MTLSIFIININLAEQNLGLNLTVVPQFHSHLETMSSLTPDELVSDISFSYLLEDQKVNVVDISGPFPQSVDPTRYLLYIYVCDSQSRLCKKEGKVLYFL